MQDRSKNGEALRNLICDGRVDAAIAFLNEKGVANIDIGYKDWEHAHCPLSQAISM